MTEIKLILKNSAGLHLRPASKITKIASKYTSEVTVSRNNKSIDAKSISMLMALGLPKGAEITILANGPDERDCINELRDLIENHFFEE